MPYSKGARSFTSADLAVSDWHASITAFNEGRSEKTYWECWTDSLERRHDWWMEEYFHGPKDDPATDWYRKILAMILMFGPSSHVRILDFGGASAWHYEVLRDMLNRLGCSGLEVSCDVVESPLAASYLAEKYTRPGVRFFDDITKAKGPYDFAIARGVLHVVAPPYDPYQILDDLLAKAPVVFMGLVTACPDLDDDAFLTWHQNGSDFLGAFSADEGVPTWHRIMAQRNIVERHDVIAEWAEETGRFEYAGVLYPYRNYILKPREQSRAGA